MKPTTRVDQKRIEGARHAVGPGFERELIDAVMRLGRKGAALAGFEVHDVVAHPARRRAGDDARARARALRAAVQIDAKAALAASVPATDWNSRSTGAPRSRAASCVVMWARQQVCVGISYDVDQAIEPVQDRADRFDRLDGRDSRRSPRRRSRRAGRRRPTAGFRPDRRPDGWAATRMPSTPRSPIVLRQRVTLRILLAARAPGPCCSSAWRRPRRSPA